ncbi:MAG: hypothetical protein ACYCO3_02355 [Mycobacteriales bacterium]
MVRIRRPDDDGGGAFAVRVDQRPVGALSSGDELVLYLPAGEHTVSASFAWISSGPVRVEVSAGARLAMYAKRRFGFGPFDVRYFTQRRTAIELGVRSPD